MDVEIQESGKWKGQAKLSKRGCGLLRQILYLAATRSMSLEDSAFGAYYHHLVARGRKSMSVLMAVMLLEARDEMNAIVVGVSAF